MAHRAAHEAVFSVNRPKPGRPRFGGGFLSAVPCTIALRLDKGGSPLVEIHWLELLAIVLAMLSITVTIIGFFASLKFYRDGSNLQQEATKILNNLEVKADAMQQTVSGNFQMMLDKLISPVNEAAQDVAQIADETGNEELAQKAEELERLLNALSESSASSRYFARLARSLRSPTVLTTAMENQEE